MAITLRSTKGSALTYAELDANFTELSGGSSAYASLGLYSNQSIAINSSATIQWTAKVDDNSWYNASNYRITPTTSGRYFVAMQVHFPVVNNSFQVNVQLIKNSTVSRISDFAVSGASFNGITLHANAIIDMNGSTDYITGLVFNGDTGSSRNITGDANQQWTTLEIFKL
jgi:hypothetical protein